MRIRKNKKRIDPRYFLHETALREDEDRGEFTQEDAANLLRKIYSCRGGNKDFNQAIGSLASQNFDYGVEGPGKNIITYTINFKDFNTLKWIFGTIEKICPECLKKQGLATPPTDWQWKYSDSGRLYQGSFNVPSEKERQTSGAGGSMTLLVNKDDFSTC